ncbi:MAG: GAF domain-containing protein [Armatimonadota bacterium]
MPNTDSEFHLRLITGLKTAAELSTGDYTPEQALRGLMQVACDITQASSGAIGLLEDEGTTLHIVAAAGENGENVLGMRTRLQDSIMSSVFDGDGHAQELPESTQSTAVRPLVCQNEFVGAVVVMNRIGGTRFSENDLDALQMLTAFIVSVTSRAQLQRTSIKQKAQLEVVYEATRQLSSMDITRQLDGLVETVSKHLEQTYTALFLLMDEDDTRLLYIAAERGLDGDQREVSLDANTPFIAKLMQDRKSVIYNDVAADHIDPIIAGTITGSMLLAPIYSTHALGLLVVGSAGRNAYSHEDGELISTVLQQAGLALENAMNYEELQRREVTVRSLYELSDKLSGTWQLDEALNLIVNYAQQMLSVDRCAVLLLDKENSKLTLAQSKNIPEGAFPASITLKNDGILANVVEELTPRVITDLSCDPDQLSYLAGITCSICALPITFRNEVLGVICVASDIRREFSDRDITTLYIITNHAAVAVDNARKLEEEHRKSEDMRRYFMRAANTVRSLRKSEAPRLTASFACDVTDASCAIYFRTTHDTCQIIATSGEAAANLENKKVDAAHVQWVIRNQRHLLVNDMRSDARFQSDPMVLHHNMRSCLVAPLDLGEETGVLALYSDSTRAFRRRDVEIVNTIAELIKPRL